MQERRAGHFAHAAKTGFFGRISVGWAQAKLDLSALTKLFEHGQSFELTEEEYERKIKRHLPKTDYLKKRSPVAKAAKDHGYVLRVEDRAHRVYGSVAFGKRVDLPLDSVSAVSTSIFGGVGISTSSGVIKLKMIKNKRDIHNTLSKLLIERQAAKAEVPSFPKTRQTKSRSSKTFSTAASSRKKNSAQRKSSCWECNPPTKNGGSTACFLRSSYSLT